MFVPRFSSRAAFTLLELILVLAIAAALLSVVAASLRGFYAERKVDDAATHLVALLHQGQQRAVRDGTVYRMVVDPDEREYQMVEASAGFDRPIESEWGRVFSLPEHVELWWDGESSSSQVHAIQLSPDGTVEPFKFLLVGPNGTTRMVSNLAAGGALTVFSYEESGVAEGHVNQMQ